MFVILLWDNSDDIRLAESDHHETATFGSLLEAESFAIDNDFSDYYKIVEIDAA